MNKNIDMFDIIIDEIQLKQKGGVLTPTLKDGYVTVKEKSFLDTFDDEVRDGVDGILERLKLNERTKKDIKATGEFVEGVGKGLFAGGIVNPLDLVLPDDSVFMQQAREAVQFDPEYKVNTFGYEASKFFGSFLGLGKLLAIGKLGSQTAKLGSFGQDALRSLASTFTGYEATDENLADAIIAMGADPEDFPVLQQLMTNPDDSEFEGRLKNVLADLPIEALVPTISTVIKSIKKGDPTAINQNTQNLEKEIKELLDKQSVGSAINPEGELAQSIIEQADKNTNVSKLAPTEGKVVNLEPKTDRLNFYSKAEEVTNQLKQNKGTGQQYRQQLLKAGVKPDEIEWLGLDDVLNKGKITKQELQDQINANRIELDEVELSGSADDALDGLASRFNENETPMSAEDAYGPEYLNNRADEIFEEIEKGQPSALLKAQRVSGDKKEFTIDDTYKQAEAEYNYNPIMKYVDPETGYTITGNDDLGYSIFRSEADSSNLRNAIGYNESNPSQSRDVPYSLNEAVIKAEEDMMDRGVAGMAGEGTRFGEYTEPGGDNYREFLIKYDDPKVQFDESHFDEENVIAHFRTKDRTTSDGKKVFYIEEIQSDWGQKGRQRGFKQSEEEMREISNKRKQAQTKLDKYIKQVQDSGEDLAGKDLDEATALRMYLQQTQNFVIDNDQKIFKAPFITDTDKWTQLTLKRILSKAVDEGYDFVSLTPGKAQMDRWNDEGVAKFYDEIVPKNAEKIVKKLDKNAIQKDKEIGIEGSTGYGSDTALYAEKRFSIELTPQLKEKVKKGMAMFSATPLVVGQENE